MNDAARPRDTAPPGHLVTLSPCHLVILALALAASPAAAQQTAPPDGSFYAPKLTFQIPFVVGAGETRIREVQLYVRGKDGRWEQVGTARPGDTKFPFTATGDGWYDFTVRTID